MNDKEFEARYKEEKALQEEKAYFEEKQHLFDQYVEQRKADLARENEDIDYLYKQRAKTGNDAIEQIQAETAKQEEYLKEISDERDAALSRTKTADEQSAQVEREVAELKKTFQRRMRDAKSKAKEQVKKMQELTALEERETKTNDSIIDTRAELEMIAKLVEEQGKLVESEKERLKELELEERAKEQEISEERDGLIKDRLAFEKKKKTAEKDLIQEIKKMEQELKYMEDNQEKVMEDMLAKELRMLERDEEKLKTDRMRIQEEIAAINMEIKNAS